MTRSLFVLVSALGLAACTVNTAAPTPNPAPVPVDTDAGPAVDAAVVQPTLGFQPSNVSLMGIDLSDVGDQDVNTDCAIQTGNDPNQDTCFDEHVARANVTQSDGSKVTLIVVKSMNVEPNAHITVGGPIPLVIVSLSDLKILGTLDAHAARDVATCGGFAQTSGADGKGSGPGGGAAGSGVGETTPGVGGGGASYCGLGGKGAAEMDSAALPGSPTAAYGAVDLRPLVGGSSGGDGDLGAGAGGGAIQFVAGGAFTMAAGSYINVGGGGGSSGGTNGQNAGGGGSGGSVLIEATTVTISGMIAANGGGGGAGGLDAAPGLDGTPDSHFANGGSGGSVGGAGSSASSIIGADGSDVAGSSAGGGGGGAGRIRVNSMSGIGTLASGSTSPASTTTCVTQGKLRAMGTSI
ncbi:MAG: hypothetical protein ABIP89_20030 [Polyangiaceae bacterium]